MNKIELHQQILNEMHDLYEKKNHDYGDSVHDTYIKYGLTSFLVRIEDKLNRIRTLDKNRDDIKITDEKIEDTLLDLANYAVIALVEEKLNKNILDNNPSVLDNPDMPWISSNDIIKEAIKTYFNREN